MRNACGPEIITEADRLALAEETVYDCARSVSQADYNTLYDEVRRLNKEREIYKGTIGAHDMKLCVEAARDLEYEIEW